ncbi:probable protein phosphatase 2C 49 isoform X2, partial [Tanacetum coccineum]
SDDVYKWENLPSSFYAVSDGHGGSAAASYVKDHAMRLFFENSYIPKATTLDRPKRVEELGGYFEDGYLNGELAVTRALGDRCMKSESPLIAEPEMTQMVLTKDDEFMIIGCDGIWDVS